MRALEWVLKIQKHVQMWYILSEPAGMSIIIINRRNSSSSLCSLLITQLWMMRTSQLCPGDAATEAVMIFGVPAEQQQCTTCFFSPQLFLIKFKWSEHGSIFPWAGMQNQEWIQSEKVITERLEWREERAFAPLQALITSPSADWIHLVFFLT